MSYENELNIKLDYDVASTIAAQYLCNLLDNDTLPANREIDFMMACQEVLHFIMLPEEWEKRFNRDFVEYAEESSKVDADGAVLYHSFWGEGEYDDRSAFVKTNDKGFFVEMWSDTELIETRPLYEHSEIYAENCAENWVLGVI